MVYYNAQGLPDYWDGEQPDQWWYEELPLLGADESGFWTVEGLTAEDWFYELLQDDEYLLAEYGMDHHDIISALIDEGMWDDRDWEIWSQAYAES